MALIHEDMTSCFAVAGQGLDALAEMLLVPTDGLAR